MGRRGACAASPSRLAVGYDAQEGDRRKVAAKSFPLSATIYPPALVGAVEKPPGRREYAIDRTWRAAC